MGDVREGMVKNLSRPILENSKSFHLRLSDQKLSNATLRKLIEKVLAENTLQRSKGPNTTDHIEVL